MENGTHSLLVGDCVEVMRGMDPCSFDAIVTDPPYGLAFMGSEWDSFNGRNGRQTTKERQDEGRRYAEENKGAPRYGNSHGKRVTLSEMYAYQVAMEPVFGEMLRVAKPGSYLLSFGGTRTFHRLACAIENAGWNIRDCVMWVHSQGYPKGMNVSKAIDRHLGATRGKVPTTGGLARNDRLNDDNWSKIGQKDALMDDDVPVTEEAMRWQGWNTQIKPAWEPIIVAQKPLDGTVVHNVMTHGVGAMNIDGCRVPTEPHDPSRDGKATAEKRYADKGSTNFAAKPGPRGGSVKGRFPANLVHDGSEDVLALFPDSKGQQGSLSGGEASSKTKEIYGQYGPRQAFPRRGDSGSAARFYYCAKASKKDRGEGNNHSTVKPTALMRWLVRLVCPPGGVVLDPFMGSGSTGVACAREGMRFVGIDMDEHYCDIAEKRISEAYAEGRCD